MKRNVASQLIVAQMISTTDGSDVTTGTCNVAVEKDGAAGAGGTATHIANGKWEYAPIQGDTDAAFLTFQFVLTGAITATIQTFTTFPQTVDNDVLAAGATGFAAIDTVVDGIQTDLSNATDGLGAIKTSVDAIPTTAMRGTDNAALATALTTAQADLDTITDADGVILGAAGVDLVWDEVLNAAGHNVASSAGRRLRQLQDSGSYNNGGAVIYIDTVHGVAGTTLYENGTITNPVDTIGDAVTLMTNLPAHQLYVSPDSTLAPIADLINSNIFGIGYTFNLGGHDYAGTHVYHASPLSGIATTAGAADHFDVLDSIITTMTSDDLHATNCIFTDTLTLGTSGIVSPTVNINHCKSGIAGAAAPVVTKTSGATLTMSVRDWRGGITVSGLESGDTVTLDGVFGTVTLNGADATVEVRGSAKALVNNLTGSPSVNRDGLVIGSEIVDILDDTNELQTDDVPGLIAALNNLSAADILTTQLTEAYAADGAAPTLTQALMLIQQMLGDFSISGTTMTVKGVDGATSKATFTLNDGTNPTSLTRAT